MTSTTQPTPTTGVSEAQIEAFSFAFTGVNTVTWFERHHDDIKRGLEAALSTAPAGDGVPSMAEALLDHNDALRSAFQVADRRGEMTNWETLARRIHEVLAKHHAVTNAARAMLSTASTAEKG